MAKKDSMKTFHDEGRKMAHAKKEPKMDRCPMCGLEREEGEPTYMCAECGSEGFDCCVAGNNTLCGDCEMKDDD